MTPERALSDFQKKMVILVTVMTFTLVLVNGVVYLLVKEVISSQPTADAIKFILMVMLELLRLLLA